MEQLVQAKIESLMISIFSKDSKQSGDKIAATVLDFMHELIQKSVRTNMDQYMGPCLKEHVGTHHVDPTLVALIKSFVPQLEDLTLHKMKSSATPNDRRSSIKQTKNKNHANFNRTYTNFRDHGAFDIDDNRARTSPSKGGPDGNRLVKMKSIMDILTNEERVAHQRQQQLMRSQELRASKQNVVVTMEKPSLEQRTGSLKREQSGATLNNENSRQR